MQGFGCTVDRIDAADDPVKLGADLGSIGKALVGAGGIGFELMGSLRIMQYQEVSAILLVILLMVTLVDTFSSTLRKRFK